MDETKNLNKAQEETLRRIGVDQPAVYSIRVVGVLNKSWSDRLSGLAILTYNTILTDDMEVTTLTGKLQDQAALVGVLNTLYNLRLPLLSVEYMGIPGDI